LKGAFGAGPNFSFETMITTCSGIQSNYSQVCSQHAPITIIVCATTVIMELIVNFTIAVMLETMTLLCSGNGVCSSPNSCQCNPNYFGM